MELKEFVKKVVLDLDSAVSEANLAAARQVRFMGVKESRTALEFDIAVTVETTEGSDGGGRINVLGIGQIGGEIASQFKNSTVSRVSFGLDISGATKAEMATWPGHK